MSLHDMATKKPKLGSGQRFAAIENKVKAEGKSAEAAKAIAAAAGRAKWGAAKMAKMAAAGKKKG